MITRIEPSYVNQVYPGQRVLMRPSSRDFNDMEILGEVSIISEGLKTDERSGLLYYEVSVSPDLSGLEERGARLVSGMPFEVAVQTAERTPFDYFMDPVYRSFRRAFSE